MSNFQLERYQLIRRDGGVVPQELCDQFAPMGNAWVHNGHATANALYQADLSHEDRMALAGGFFAIALGMMSNLIVGETAGKLDQPLPDAQEVEAETRAEIERFFPDAVRAALTGARNFRAAVMAQMEEEAKSSAAH